MSGYIPLHNELNEPLRVSDYTGQYPIDQYKLHLFQAIVDSCKNAGIKMYVVCSPYYSTFLGKESSIESCKEATQKNGLHYFDFSQDSFFLNKPQLFDDTIHVNYKGSLLFSKMVCDKILSGQ